MNQYEGTGTESVTGDQATHIEIKGNPNVQAEEEEVQMKKETHETFYPSWYKPGAATGAKLMMCSTQPADIQLEAVSQNDRARTESRHLTLHESQSELNEKPRDVQGSIYLPGNMEKCSCLEKGSFDPGCVENSSDNSDTNVPEETDSDKEQGSDSNLDDGERESVLPEEDVSGLNCSLEPGEKLLMKINSEAETTEKQSICSDKDIVSEVELDTVVTAVDATLKKDTLGVSVPEGVDVPDSGRSTQSTIEEESGEGSDSDSSLLEDSKQSQDFETKPETGVDGSRETLTSCVSPQVSVRTSLHQYHHPRCHHRPGRFTPHPLADASTCSPSRFHLFCL